MVFRLANRVRVTTATVGAGQLTLGSPIAGYQSLPDGGITDGDQSRYLLTEGAEWEKGTGTYTAIGTLWARSPEESSNGGAAIVLAGNAVLELIAAAEDIPVTRREVLAADRTYYVRTDGSDSNDGLTDNSGGAFLTLQRAFDAVATIDFNGFAVVIQMGNGAYATTVSPIVPVTVGQAEVADLIVRGDTTTPSNVVFSSGTAFAGVMTAPSGARCGIEGIRIVTSVGNARGLASSGGRINLNGNMEFGAFNSGTGEHIHVSLGGNITIGATNYTISGGASSHINLEGAGTVITFGGTTTLTGTPAFTQFVNAQFASSNAQLFGRTFSGSATGSRFRAADNAVINTFGQALTYFPGNAAGTTPNGGLYV